MEVHLYAKRIYKKFLDVEVDGFNYTVRYIIRAMYDVVDAEGFQRLNKKSLKM